MLLPVKLPPSLTYYYFYVLFKELRFLQCVCLVGPMDKASVYGTGDSGFDSQAGLDFYINSFFILKRISLFLES